ncbi:MULTISPECIES: flavin-containing monooxygenase [unclassified Marinovum]
MHVVIIGAGPAGLACAVCAQKAGAKVTMLERFDKIAPSWHGHYERLHLHTVKGRSGLPYMPMPKHFLKLPSRAQMVEYLGTYADAFALRPEFGVTVETVRAQDGCWRVAHNKGEVVADAVIFATGLNGTPYRADLPGADSFAGTILHSSDYQSAQAFSGKSVLVVGFGNSGGDISVDLADAGARVTLSVRGPVNILPHDLFGIPITSLGGLRKFLPYKWADALTAPILRAKIGRPEDYGLQSAGKGPAAQVIEDGRVPLIDVGTLPAIKAGRIAVKPGIARVEESDVQFVDETFGGFDAIILCTGYRTDLRAVLPESPHVLDKMGSPLISGEESGAKGLYFCSYKASADGQLHQTGIEAKAIAKLLAG